jgi:hypothetical protein
MLLADAFLKCDDIRIHVSKPGNDAVTSIRPAVFIIVEYRMTNVITHRSKRLH